VAALLADVSAIYGTVNMGTSLSKYMACWKFVSY